MLLFVFFAVLVWYGSFQGRRRLGGLAALAGGLFVLLIPNAINVPLMYLGAIVAGTLVTGIGYALIKKGAQQVETAAAT